MTDARTQAIHAWMEADKARKYWTQREMELRLYIATQGFGYNPDVERSLPDGTHRLDLGNNYALKLTTGTEYFVQAGAALAAAMEACRDLNVPLPKPLIKWTPKLSVTAYKAAPEQVVAKLAPALTTKNKAVQLELEGIG